MSLLTVVELSLISEEKGVVVPPVIQEVIDQFPEVFAVPTGLPPERAFDHSIPLVPGARPFSMKPYRLASELKDEVENRSRKC